MNRLKRCPLCKGKMLLKKTTSLDPIHVRYCLECSRCGAKTLWYLTKEDLFAYWMQEWATSVDPALKGCPVCGHDAGCKCRVIYGDYYVECNFDRCRFRTPAYPRKEDAVRHWNSGR